MSEFGSYNCEIDRLVRFDISIRSCRYNISLFRKCLGFSNHRLGFIELWKMSIRFSVRESARIRPFDRLYNFCGWLINIPETLDGLGLGFVTFYDNLNN